SETSNGVRILRCWHYVPATTSTPRRVLHELSFVAASFLILLFTAKPDLLIVVTSPLLLGVAARVVFLLRGGRYLLHIQDLHPDAAIKLGMVQSKIVIDLLHR